MERDARGRFCKGNSGGPGKPAHKAERLRKALWAARSQKEYDALYAELLSAAKAGQLWAAKLILRLP